MSTPAGVVTPALTEGSIATPMGAMLDPESHEPHELCMAARVLLKPSTLERSPEGELVGAEEFVHVSGENTTATAQQVDSAAVGRVHLSEDIMEAPSPSSGDALVCAPDDDADPPADVIVRDAGSQLELDAEPADDTDARVVDAPNTAEIIVPVGVSPGQIFRIVIADGRELTIRCPEDAGPGDVLEIDLPPSFGVVADEPEPESPARPAHEVETVEVEVPAGLVPGQAFTATSSWGDVFEVVVPKGTAPGSTLFVELPKPLPESSRGASVGANVPEVTISLFV